MDCIFCKIIAKEIPAAVFYENEDIIAFLDAFPAVEGHSLVVPKKHVESFRESEKETIFVANVLPRLAKAVASSLNAEGVNILCNDGKGAGQVVPHVHFHIVPRKEGDGLKFQAPQQQGDLEKLKELANRYKQTLTEG